MDGKETPDYVGGAVDNIKISGEHDRIACGHGIGTCAITWEGKVANCAVDADAKVIWGDVNTSSIKEIWQKRNKELLTAHINQIIGEERFDEKGNSMNKDYSLNHELFQK